VVWAPPCANAFGPGSTRLTGQPPQALGGPKSRPYGNDPSLTLTAFDVRLALLATGADGQTAEGQSRRKGFGIKL